MELSAVEFRKHYEHMHEHGTLPPGLSDLSVCDAEGMTVAHYAVRFNIALPVDFEGWHWASNEGWTVLHEVFVNRPFSTPPEKVDWTLSDIHGWTVAHVAAQSSGELPAGFRGWSMRAIDGQTVAHVFLMSGKPFPDDFPLEVWREEDGEGISVIEKAKASGRIDLVAQYECSVIQANRSQDTFGDARITRRRV